VRLQTKGKYVAFQVTEVQKALKGVDYPASPEELAGKAEENGGAPELVETLRVCANERLTGRTRS
jgi:hypothetical protein